MRDLCKEALLDIAVFPFKSKEIHRNILHTKFQGQQLPQTIEVGCVYNIVVLSLSVSK